MKRSWILATAGAVVLATSLWAGVRGFAADIRLAFVDAPRHAIPPEILEQARLLKARIPRDAYVLYVGNQTPPDNWFSRLWQRALYPRRVLILEQGKRAVTLDTKEQLRVKGLEELRAEYSVRYALSAGNPPTDPGFLTREELSRIPQYPYVTWFGVLKP